MQWLKAIVIAVLGALLAVTPAAGRDPKSDEQALLRLEDEWFYSRGGETRERIYARLRAHHRRGEILTRQEELEHLGKHSLPPQDNSRRSLSRESPSLWRGWNGYWAKL